VVLVSITVALTIIIRVLLEPVLITRTTCSAS
jgi:hypothetical protein